MILHTSVQRLRLACEVLACCTDTVQVTLHTMLFTGELLAYCTDILQSQVGMFCGVLASTKTCLTVGKIARLQHACPAGQSYNSSFE